MCGRTTVSSLVGIAYFPFFFAAFLAAGFFAEASALGAFADLTFATALGVAFVLAFPAFAGARDSALSPVSSLSCGAVPCRADCSMTTRSDHKMWYVDTSLYGITCTFGRLRPLRNTFGFAPLVSTSTFFSAAPTL